MKPEDPKHPWSRLAATARRAPDERGTVAPYGFSTRVAALAMAPERVASSLIERLSLRALGVACLIALMSVAVNYSTITSTLGEEENLMADDPVSEVINLAV